MKSVVYGIGLMVIIAVVAAFGLKTQLEQTAGERHSSSNNSVRLGD